MINDYESISKKLLNKTGKPNMNLRRNRSFCIKFYETLNNLNLEFKRDLFMHRATKSVKREKYKFNLEIRSSVK